MNYCDLTFVSPAENLACDEALLDLCEEGHVGDLLRFWESTSYFVVLGYSNQATREVNLAFCRANAIPVLRRCTGGGTVLQGPGVLNYSLILRFDTPGPLDTISATNAFILERHRASLTALLGAPVEVQGQTDLAIGELKFCGNAQRRRKHSLIFHGSFLLDMDLPRIEEMLPMPSKHPSYRRNRAHREFLMNLKAPSDSLKAALAKSWNAMEPLALSPGEKITALVREKYSNDEWNLKF